MIELVIIIIVIFGGVYYLTGLDFEIGSGISEQKDRAREASYEVKEEKKVEIGDGEGGNTDKS